MHNINPTHAMKPPTVEELRLLAEAENSHGEYFAHSLETSCLDEDERATEEKLYREHKLKYAALTRWADELEAKTTKPAKRKARK